MGSIILVKVVVVTVGRRVGLAVRPVEGLRVSEGVGGSVGCSEGTSEGA